MARYDKYNPVSGGFRAPLNAAILTADAGKIQAVKLNGSGKVVPVAALTDDCVGVLVVNEAKGAGDIVDVMTDGEIVDCTSLTAGTTYFAKGDATIWATGPTPAGTNGTRVGHTVEATRLVVRVQKVQA